MCVNWVDGIKRPCLHDLSFVGATVKWLCELRVLVCTCLVRGFPYTGEINMHRHMWFVVIIVQCIIVSSCLYFTHSRCLVQCVKLRNLFLSKKLKMHCVDSYLPLHWGCLNLILVHIWGSSQLT